MLPDLSQFTVHREVADPDLDGTILPGLHATFHRRAAGSRIESVGVYRYAGVEVFMAWGYVDEPHCRFTAYAGPHGWGAPRRGCPSVDAVRDQLATLGRCPIPTDPTCRLPETANPWSWSQRSPGGAPVPGPG